MTMTNEKVHKELILKSINDAHLYTYPYPYIYIENFLPEEIYSKILESYPTSNDFENVQNNSRYQINTEIIYKNPERYQYYIQLIENVFDQEFYEVIIKKFETSLQEYYPDLDFNKQVSLRSKKSVKRKNKSIDFDFQPGINSPVTRQCSVRKPHIDAHNELFAGLLYLRDDNDTSRGGNLDLYRKKENIKMKINKRKEIKDEGDRTYLKKTEILNMNSVEHVRTIDYGKNNFILFLNTKESVHGVSERNITNYERRLINFIYDIN